MREAAFQEIPDSERILQFKLIFHFQLAFYSKQTYQIFFFQTLQVLALMSGKQKRLIPGKSMFRSRVSSGEGHKLPPFHNCFSVCPSAILRSSTSSWGYRKRSQGREIQKAWSVCAVDVLMKQEGMDIVLEFSKRGGKYSRKEVVVEHQGQCGKVW